MPNNSRTTSCVCALLDVSSTPDMRDVDELVVTKVSANWQRMALRLGVEGCVSEVVLKNHPNDCEGACQDMLDRWLRAERHTGEEKRTWSTLLTALGKAGFEELERRLPQVIPPMTFHCKASTCLCDANGAVSFFLYRNVQTDTYFPGIELSI